MRLKRGDWGSVQYGAKAKFSRPANGGWSATEAGAAAGAVVAAGSCRSDVAPSSSTALPPASASNASTVAGL